MAAMAAAWPTTLTPDALCDWSFAMAEMISATYPSGSGGAKVRM